MGGCRCAPLRVPLKRRLQTLAIALNFPPLTLLYCVVVWALLMIFANTYVRALLVLYTIWSFVDRAPATGGWNLPRLTRFVRSSWVHRYAFEFFGPTSSIVKTCELDPSKRYLFGYHPHGIICVGAALAFATGGAGFSDIFPGVDVSLLVLKPLFRVPFYREWLLAHNILSAGRKTCINLLTGKYETADDGVDDCNAGETGPKSKGGKCKPTKGRSICLAIGGAREGLDAVPNTMQLTILHRKGFVKVAVEAGASLVPVIGFGENELFNQVRLIFVCTWLFATRPSGLARSSCALFRSLIFIVQCSFEIGRRRSRQAASVAHRSNFNAALVSSFQCSGDEAVSTTRLAFFRIGTLHFHWHRTFSSLTSLTPLHSPL